MSLPWFADRLACGLPAGRPGREPGLGLARRVWARSHGLPVFPRAQAWLLPEREPGIAAACSLEPVWVVSRVWLTHRKRALPAVPQPVLPAQIGRAHV